MKIKAKFEFEGELPKELWWINDVDWGDEAVMLTLEEFGKGIQLVLTHGESVLPLKTEFTGMEIFGTIRDQDA